MSGLFVCPLCGGALERQGGSYLCPNGHCHDVLPPYPDFKSKVLPSSPPIYIR